MKFEWQEIWNNQDGHKIENQPDWFEATYRAKVIGGWLVRHVTCYLYDYPDGDKGPLEEGWSKRNSEITFVSDEKHEWNIE
jgi:hypothetical protein